MKKYLFVLFIIAGLLGAFFGPIVFSQELTPKPEPTMRPAKSRVKIPVRYLREVTLEKDVLTTALVTRFRFGHDVNGYPAIIEQEYIKETTTKVPFTRMVLAAEYYIDIMTGEIKTKKLRR